MFQLSDEIELPRPDVEFGENRPAPVLSNYLDGPTYWPPFSLPNPMQIVREAIACGVTTSLLFLFFDGIRVDAACIKWTAISALVLDGVIWSTRIVNYTRVRLPQLLPMWFPFLTTFALGLYIPRLLAMFLPTFVVLVYLYSAFVVMAYVLSRHLVFKATEYQSSYPVLSWDFVFQLARVRANPREFRINRTTYDLAIPNEQELDPKLVESFRHLIKRLVEYRYPVIETSLFVPVVYCVGAYYLKRIESPFHDLFLRLFFPALSAAFVASCVFGLAGKGLREQVRRTTFALKLFVLSPPEAVQLTVTWTDPRRYPYGFESRSLYLFLTYLLFSALLIQLTLTGPLFIDSYASVSSADYLAAGTRLIESLHNWPFDHWMSLVFLASIVLWPVLVGFFTLVHFCGPRLELSHKIYRDSKSLARASFEVDFE